MKQCTGVGGEVVVPGGKDITAGTERARMTYTLTSRLSKEEILGIEYKVR